MEEGLDFEAFTSEKRDKGKKRVVSKGSSGNGAEKSRKP
jgi:hypothetical protein